MDIKYKNTIDGIDWYSASKLFKAVEWGEREPDELKVAFGTSSHVRFAFDGEEIVGFGRTVDDGKYYALIVDLVVSPNYQGKGIGSKLLSELKNELEEYYFTTLTSAVGKEGFYHKQGWKKQKTAFIWPRSEKQRNDHAKNS
jgi:aralkylamine N-acetyltransferase